MSGAETLDAPSGSSPAGAEPSRLDDERPWTRAERWTLAALVLAMLGSLFVTVHPQYDQANDAALYVHTARSIAAGDGYSYHGVPFIIRPPGFSLLIAPLAAHPTDFLLLNTLVSLSGVLCVALLFAFYRPRLGALVSAALCVFVWLNPLFQELCTQVMSDVPGAAFVFGALLLDRAARRRPTVGRHALLGLCIAAGLYVRSVCMLLIPAVLLARLAQRFLAADRERARRALKTCWPVLLLPVAAWMPWSLRNAGADIPVPPQHVFLHSYSTALWHEHPAYPDSPRLTAAQILERVPGQLEEMLPLLGAGYRQDTGIAQGTAFALAILGIVCATAVLIRRRNAAEFLFGGVLMVLAIYFAFKPRLALTLFLLGPPTICEVALWLGRTQRGRQVISVVLALALIVPSALSFDPDRGARAREGAAAERAQLIRFLDKRFPNGEAVAMPTAWHVGVETDRPMYGLQVTAQRKGIAAALEMVEQYDIAAVVANLRRPGGVEYAQAFNRVYRKSRTVGDWAVFFTR